MTDLQRLALRMSEIRTRLSELGGMDTLEDEQRAELDALRNEYGDLERRSQALTIAADDPDEPSETRSQSDPETRELAELERRADIGGIFDAAISGGQTNGAEAELQQHLGMAANQVPLALLHETRDAGDDLEVRTAGVTPAPAAGSIGATQRPIIPAVFPMSVASFLRIPQPTVGVGEQVYTVVSTSAAPGTPAEGVDQAHSTLAFAANTLSPKRIQASLFYSREDRARLMGMGEALRQNLSDALADKLDEVVVDDLLTGNTLTSDDASAADSFNSYRERFAYDHVDGKRAGTVADMRIVVGTDTYASMASKFRGNSSDSDVLAVLRQETGGVRVTAHAPDTASNKQRGVVRIGARQDAVTPIWEGVSLIMDEVTQAKAGEIVLTAVMLYSHKVLRTAGFAKVQAQHA